MARIAGVDLPKNKRLDIALTYIFGVGRTTALKVLDTAGIDWMLKTDDLSGDQVNTIRKELEDNYKVEGDLRRNQVADIKRLMDIGSYRGLRHRRGLPVRGQSSKTNARTRKGPRRSVMSRKKK
ncbi:30S ribosomal protein S13 [Maridesulfovibrio ferrireducens]|uniref:30S ribosomal protein S13 n=1 Tax=Maridesulfovibrio ferrireducens TaxID=246191 RepID=UPI001A226F90|nr:30S ribosomal protein S13 [Maridesulfovibrio ferrireducens]MBI9110994.1 30S ribosomal protein S13 [Maridesulfovibrio ferrireducens]